jgi:hypothetical protein
MAQRRVSARGGGWTSDRGKKGPLIASAAANTNEPGLKKASTLSQERDLCVSGAAARLTYPVPV